MIYAQAGVLSAQLSRFAAENALTGFEFLIGIPGTVGGALTMNAGHTRKRLGIILLN